MQIQEILFKYLYGSINVRLSLNIKGLNYLKR
jgi:hypothetical protein